MTLHIKKFFFTILVFIGCYIFYNEYKYLEFIVLNSINNQSLEKLIDNEDKNVEIKNTNIKKQEEITEHEKKFTKVEVIINKGDTFFSILKKYELSDNRIFEIVNQIEKYYNLKKLKVNDKLVFYTNIKKEIKKIHINLDINSILVVSVNDLINVEKRELEISSYQASNEFKIINSLYADGLQNNLPQDILIKIIKLFSFDLDFQRDIKRNTIVSVSYTYDQVKENNRIKYRDINYALISIDGKKLEYFKFITDDGYLDYFNREGKNVKKSILKTPLDGARLSSNFGMRKHPISGYNKMHKGVDFAAPVGTPIYAGGNGVVEYVGYNVGYGNYIRIRHNNEYKTAYAHLSKFKKGISKGVRVNQGDIIGYVGSTGMSTGPHLHYEILFQNKQINPLKLKLPSGKILEGKELERFKKEYNQIYADHLNLLYE